MKILLPILLGTAHALNDFLSGYVLANYTNELSNEDAVTMLVLYGVLAFGGQVPVGLWVNKYKNEKTATLLALIFLLLGSALTYSYFPIVTIIALGIASALLHVAGGSWVLKIAPQQSGITGVFVAPGVAGLTLGGFLGSMEIMHIPLYVFIFGLLLMLAIWRASRSYIKKDTISTQQSTPAFERHDAVMLLILAAICLRSLLWDIINLFYAGDNNLLLLAIGLSAFSGKIIGGFISDSLGWKRWLQISLPVAALLLAFLGENAVALCIGAALLQSTTPMMVRLMYNVFPGEPAIAVSLSLGLGILLAGIPAYLPFFSENLPIVLLAVCTVLPLYGWWLVRRLQ